MLKTSYRLTILVIFALILEIIIYLRTNDFGAMFLAGGIVCMGFILWVTPAYNELINLVTGKKWLRSANWWPIFIAFSFGAFIGNFAESSLIQWLLGIAIFLFVILAYLFFFAALLPALGFKDNESNDVIVSKLGERNRED